jgi:DNA polymerase-3 subunit delta'
MGLSAYKRYGRAADLIKKSILAGQPAQAYIIEGDSIVDKKAFALAFAQAMFCPESPGEGCGTCPVCMRLLHGNYEDYYYVAGDEKTGNLRDSAIKVIQEDLFHRPSAEGGRNFAVIDNADTMTAQAQSRILKTLEEPLPGTVIVLLSENRDNLFQTIRSRCVIYRLEDIGPYGDKTGADNKNYLASTSFKSEEGKSYMDLAEKLLRQALNKDYFYKIKDTFEKEIRERRDALILLDAFQSLLREAMVCGEGYSLPREKLPFYMALIERTRKDIKRGVSYKYAVKAMLLEFGDEGRP